MTDNRKQTVRKRTASKKNTEAVSVMDPVFLTDYDRYLFGEGRNYKIYEKMGAHRATVNGVSGMHFAVWAPHAERVTVSCQRNDWSDNSDELTLLGTSGIFEGFIPGMDYGEMYKYVIHTAEGKEVFKADPYAFSSELRPGNASVTATIHNHEWKDGRWMKQRSETNTFESPMSIYEVHLGSWMKQDDGTPDGFMNYRKYADELADYCKYMGYTHVELMGIAEHPFDGSWGYQVTGYYAPTSRYGTPEDFQYFVDRLHKDNIGIILDWVPAHFPRDEHGLALFDGTPTYEYADPRMGEHPEWGTKIFDYSKNEVKNFLIANALYWFDEFHIDGLRVDAVASMLYLDYGRKEGEWVPNKYGGNGNLDAMEFFKHLNSIIRGRKDGTFIVAEESTAWPKITDAPENDGLGFTYKWNMGWMHDFLDYMKLDPYFRKFNHNKMTFGMSYAYSEKFILVLSHDEVVHLKCSMINKMPGEGNDKFANLKAGYAFMMGHAGKKLLFMGQDFGQEHEWDESVQLSWNECDEPAHKDLQNYYRDLLHMYKKYPANYALDDSWDGFEWVLVDDNERSIFSFIRKDRTGKNALLYLINFTPVERKDFRMGVTCKTNYTLILDEHGEVATDKEHKKVFAAKKGNVDGKEQYIEYPLPAYGVAVFRFSYPKHKTK